MNKLSLKMKLGVGFGALLVIMALMGIIGYTSAVTEAELSKEAERQVQKKEMALIADLSMEKQISALRAFLVTGVEEHLKSGEVARETFRDSMDQLEKTLQTTEGKKAFAAMQQLYGEYRPIMDEAIQLERAGKTKEAANLIFAPQATAKRNELRTNTTTLVEIADKLKKTAQDEQSASVARTKSLMLGLASVGLVVGFLIAILTARSITSAIFRMVAMTQEIAGNNLAIEDMEITSQDEIGKAGTALNSMKNNLRAVMQSIASTAEHVASASEEISASATQTANGSETQKDQVHQVATAMQEMSSTVHEVSENCNKAAESSHKAAATAREGGAIVEDTLTLMRSIADSVRESAKSVQELGSRSDQIGKIVGVIDDTADQTNLLALNAAIEAARAGEQGRGFAVVADEVRKLAERTTKATKEIAEMIQSVQAETRGAVDKMQSGTQQVEKGVEVTAKAGASLKQIIGQAEHVGEMVTHIATAANEQSSATEQVNNNMEQINRLVAESAEGAQQSAKACEQLSSLAFELQNLVSRFKLGQQTTGGGVSAGYRPPRQGAADPVRVRTALALPPKPHRVFQHAAHDRDGE